MKKRKNKKDARTEEDLIHISVLNNTNSSPVSFSISAFIMHQEIDFSVIYSGLIYARKKYIY